MHDLPQNMGPLLAEVYRALDANSHGLPIMGARTLVDMVMVEKVGDVGGFAQKLKSLEKAGYVSSKNREVLEAALDAGSAASHRGYAAKTDEVNAVMDIVENLLQAVYVLHEAARKLKKATPPRPARSPKP
jgi:CO dehydrogenase/acetyl-CoA synthase gamma subunit (corrinoid Fe-S protein)